MKLTKISFVTAITLSLFIIILLTFGFTGVSISNILELFKDGEFLSAVSFGVRTSILSVLLSATLGIPTGFFLARSNNNLTKILDTLFDIPLIIPPLVVGVLLLNLFNTKIVEEIYNFVFTFWAAVIAQFFISFPFTVKSSKTAFELVSPSYERIAMTLGASHLKSFFDTTFKLALNGILSGLVLSWLRSLSEFGATLIVAGGIANKTENIPINIYMDIVQGNFSKALAVSFLVVVFTFFSILILKVIIKKRF